MYVMYYSTIITSAMMPRDDPGETEHPCLRVGCHTAHCLHHFALPVALAYATVRGQGTRHVE
jgi:hypothetical protein